MEVKKMHPAIEQALREKGEDWVMAAMVDGSVGYHRPTSARRLIAEYIEGERECWLERCLELYDADLERMVLSDIERFSFLEEHSPETVKARIAYITAWEKRDTGDFGDATGLMYPTRAP